jgi:hypothetical protein
MINFQCEKCGHSHKISDTYAGRKILCGQCGCVNVAPPVRPAATKYVDDAMPDFTGLFMELLKYEREAPSLELAVR